MLWVASAPKRTLLAFALIFSVLMLQVQQFDFDLSVETFLAKDSPERQQYDQFREYFGVSEYFVILLRSDDVFSETFLTAVGDLQHALQQRVPYIERVESLRNGRYVQVDDDQVNITDLIPAGSLPADMAVRKVFALSSPHFLNRLVNQQGTVTALLLGLQPYYTNQNNQASLVTIKEIDQALTQIDHVVSDYQLRFNQPIIVSGSPVVIARLMTMVSDEMSRLMVLTLLITLLFIWLLFRRLSVVICAFSVLMATVLVTLTSMSLLGGSFLLTSVILPAFLIVVCVVDAVHFFHVFYQQRNKGLSAMAAVSKTATRIVPAMFFTTLTTSVGLMSFSFSSIQPIASLGGYGALGVWLAFIFTCLLLPPMLVLCSRSSNTVTRTVFSSRGTYKRIRIYLQWINRYRNGLLCVMLVVFLGSALLAKQLTFSYNMLSWLHEEDPLRQSIEYVDRTLTGTATLEILIDSGQDQGVKSVSFLRRVASWLQHIEQNLNSNIPLTSLSSLLDTVTETHNALSASAVSSSERFNLPKTDDILAQELLLLELSAGQEVSRFVDDHFRILRVRVSMPWHDSVEHVALLQTLRRSFEQHFSAPITIEFTGMVSIGAEVLQNMLYSMIKSYVIAGLLVLILLMAVLRNVKLGLAMVLPNVLPITVVLACMQYLGYPLEFFTLLIGSIAIGIIVDDVIHFSYSFQRSFTKTGRVEHALAVAFLQTGKALLVTTAVLAAGFLMFVFAVLQVLQSFGVFLALCIVLALFVHLLLIPVLVLMIYSKPHSP